MKILYHHRIASKDGQYVHIEEMVNAFRKLGHEVIIVGPSASEKAEFGSGGGVISILKKVIPGSVYELLELSYNILVYAKLVKALKTHRPDCIYERYNLYMPAGIWVKNKYKVPLILEINAPLYLERKKHKEVVLSKLAKWSELYTWRNADHVFCVTRVLADMVVGDGVDSSRVSVTPNGINADKFVNSIDTEDAKSKIKLGGKLVLGFVGFMREWHGLEQLIEYLADAEHKDLHLLLVGDGPARSQLEKLAEKLAVKDRLTITGVVPRDLVTEYIAAFDIALQPAVVPYASPLKLFEYLVMEKAIIAPASMNIMEILADGSNAILFDPEEKFALKKAIQKLVDNESLRIKLAKNAKLTIVEKRLTWDENAKKVCGEIIAINKSTGTG